MPRQLTRPEVASRLVVRAMHDAVPGTPQRELAAMFHVSLRTVNQAVRRPLQEWVAALGLAPPGKPVPPPRRSPPPPSKQPVHYLLNPPGWEQRSFGKGQREKLHPVVDADDDAGAGLDLDGSDAGWCEQDDAALDAELERQAKEAAKHG
ncbi:MAG: hypothetical protein GYA24_13475 [Candidatus Lokiarchaeota archaeon]|nr:hypothetical protein [Candidatus Lokiarchaeota archaeon]